MLKSLSKYLPKVATFFVIAAGLVTLYDWIFADVVTTTSLIKFWILTAIIVIITLFVTGVLKIGDVKEKTTSKVKEINKNEKAQTVYAVIYAVLIFIAVLMIGTVLAVKFHWNNAVTYWIAMKFNETKFLIHDLIGLAVVFIFEKISD